MHLGGARLSGKPEVISSSTGLVPTNTLVPTNEVVPRWSATQTPFPYGLLYHEGFAGPINRVDALRVQVEVASRSAGRIGMKNKNINHYFVFRSSTESWADLQAWCHDRGRL
jgi:hypothetical protein